jgi:hypothetical protein
VFPTTCIAVVWPTLWSYLRRVMIAVNTRSGMHRPRSQYGGGNSGFVSVASFITSIFDFTDEIKFKLYVSRKEHFIAHKLQNSDLVRASRDSCFLVSLTNRLYYKTIGKLDPSYCVATLRRDWAFRLQDENDAGGEWRMVSEHLRCELILPEMGSL